MAASDGVPPERWVGREAVARDRLDPWRATALALALELETPPPGEGETLPATWHWVYFPAASAHADLGEDGHRAEGGLLPPLVGWDRMWAAGAITLGAGEPRIGERRERQSRIEAIETKPGRSGPLCFLTLGHRIGGLVEQQRLVFRRQAPPGPGGDGAGVRWGAGFEPPGAAERSRERRADARMLFRYSALTYNAHRIHYDLDWCRKRAGYPGLVVHGPLLATLLFDLARGWAAETGRSVARFDYRAEAPVFHDEAFRVSGRRVGDGLELWIEGEEGDGRRRGRMRGRVRWREAG